MTRARDLADSADKDITGTLTVDGLTTSADINFGDSDKAVFGAGSDLQIYHDGSHSYIQENLSGGNLYIQASNLRINNSGGTEAFIQANENADVKLYYDGALKLATTSTGVDVTGTVNITGDGDDLIVNSADYELALLGNRGGTGVDLDKAYFRMKAEGTNTIVLDTAGNSYFNGGHLMVNTTANIRNANETGVSIESGGRIFLGRGASSGGFSHLGFVNTNGIVGTVTSSGSSTAYNTSSDYRLKENVTYDWDSTTRLKQLKPARFNFIADADKTVDGFLAHEVSDIIPEAVTGTKDAMRDEEYEVSAAEVDSDGNVTKEAVMGTRSVPEYQGIDQSKIVPILTKALIEAVEKIEALEVRIAALEAD